MKSEIRKTIEKELSKYKTKEIKIADKKYPLHVVPEMCDEDLNIFEGFLFAEAEDKSELSYLKTRYRPPVSGYAPRLGIIFYDGQLLLKDYRRNKHIIKTFKKINKTFLKKLRKTLNQPNEENLSKLFDRADVIEEFYILYKKAREYLLKNISGISEEEEREEFVDNFMMQMLTLWYLQERGFFNSDTNYFITKFEELKQKKPFNEFESYYEFLKYLFDKISDSEDRQYYEDDITGKVVVIGPAVFLNGKQNEAISIPDKCFYKKEMTEILISTPPKKVGQDVPLLNLFESRDWVEGDIDEYVLGSLYEKLMTEDVRKKTGAYYTPEEITSYICKNTIEPFLVDRVNEKFNKNFETIDQTVESNDKEILLYLFQQLKEIKILDPAVGSAHFLESAINVLVHIYEKVRDKAKGLNMKKGLEITVADEKGELKTINLLEISDDDRFKLLVKFFIILSKNIYGVDINPSALKVAKARLFLTLAKHFKVGEEKNIFIRFPNVHFNLREGNSLIGYVNIGREKSRKQLQLELFVKEDKAAYIKERIKVMSKLKPYLESTAKTLKINGNIVKEIEGLNEILEKKLSWEDFENVLKTKERLITILIVSLNSQHAIPLNNLLKEITDLFNRKLDEKFAEEYKIDLDELKKIKTFHWIFEFPEVFLRENPGFDVVVGNPPYIQFQKNSGELANIYEDKNYETFIRTGDIYTLFYERGLQLLKPNGLLSYITSNKWMRAGYGEKLREFFIKYNPKVLIDLGPAVFEKATVDTSILIIQKAKNQNHLMAITYNDKNIPIDTALKTKGVILDKLTKDTWFIASKAEIALKEKIERIGKPLKEWDVNIYRGVLTGLNKAFIISTEKRNEILANCKTEEERKRTEKIIKPILRGRDIKRYYYEWAGLWVIVIPAGWTNANRGNEEADTFIEKTFHSLMIHLKQFEEKAKKRDDQGDYWWELRKCAYYPEFEKEKVVYSEIVREPQFYYDRERFYVEASSFLMTGKNIKYICGLLNSKPATFFFKQWYAGGGLGQEGYRYKKVFLENLPIPPSNQGIVSQIEDLVDKILSAKKQNPKADTQEWEREIDRLVYRLYDLTEEEIKIIENSTF